MGFAMMLKAEARKWKVTIGMREDWVHVYTYILGCVYRNWKLISRPLECHDWWLSLHRYMPRLVDMLFSHFKLQLKPPIPSTYFALAMISSALSVPPTSLSKNALAFSTTSSQLPLNSPNLSSKTVITSAVANAVSFTPV